MGHRYATAIVQAPALPASYLMTLSAEELNKLNRFIGSLLNLTGSAYNVNVGRLWGWAVVKFSTVIMYLFEFMAAVRENNGIVRTILKCASDNGYTADNLRCLGSGSSFLSFVL